MRSRDMPGTSGPDAGRSSKVTAISIGAGAGATAGRLHASNNKATGTSLMLASCAISAAVPMRQTETRRAANARRGAAASGRSPALDGRELDADDGLDELAADGI